MKVQFSGEFQESVFGSTSALLRAMSPFWTDFSPSNPANMAWRPCILPFPAPEKPADSYAIRIAIRKDSSSCSKTLAIKVSYKADFQEEWKTIFYRLR